MPTGSGSDYYQVLGVARDAGQEQIRRAYLDGARQWHPDAFVGKSPGKVAEAEIRMRQINEAWKVLRTPSSRRAYDATLSVSPRRSTPVDGGIRTDDGVTRIDPRLLDPEFIAARRQAQYDEISATHGMLVRALPLLAVLGLLGGILVVTAYAAVEQADPGADGSSVPTVSMPEAPKLGAGIEAGDCVAVASGPSLIERPCDQLAAGRVVGAYNSPEGRCPATFTQRSVELSNGWTACLGPVG